MSPNLALSVQNVTKNFGGLTAVDQITFDVMEHDVVGLIGPNGSGKTTMLNVISGMLRSSGGKIKLYGKNIARHSANRISRQGISRTFSVGCFGR